MLHELLFSLLGFTGDVIIDDGATFRVKDGFDLLRESEKDLVNRISPLGWYYVHLSDAVQRYDMNWTNVTRKRVYMAAAVQGIADLLAEYVADVAYMEQLVLTDGPMPLSQVQQHMQKYLLVLPELHEMLVEVEESGTDGCRLLDYFCTYNTGIPVLKEVLNRVVLRIRVVFLKQCFAWMIHGELEDPGLEFFIHARSGNATEQGDRPTATLQDKVLETLLHASQQQRTGMKQNRATAAQEGAAFDWTSSFSLSLDKIPSSHVSPRIASKIVFAGKAVRLLHTSGALQGGVGGSSSGGGGRGSIPKRGTAAEYQHSEAYRYLSSGAGTDTVVAGTEDGPPAVQLDIGTSRTDRYGNGEGKMQEGSVAASVEEQVRDAFGAYVEAGGYSVADTQRFATMFSAVLTEPERAVELLETAVEAVSDCISNRLWVLLRDSCGFNSFLQVIRSSYLLGRGELFQGLLDGILQQTYSAPPEALEMDNILNWRILRTSAKLVGLENDDSLSELLTLRVSSLTLTIRNFAMHRQDVQCVGAAVETADQYQSQGKGGAGVSWGGAEAPRLGQRTHVELCRPRPSSSQRQFEEIWSGFIRKRAVGRSTQGELYTADTDSVDESLVDSLDGVRDAVGGAEGDVSLPQYHTGAVWLSDQRPVSKGFDWSATFSCGWTDLRAQLHTSHALFQSTDSAGEGSWNPFAKCGGRVLALGSVSCHLRGDRKHHAASAVSRSPLPIGAPGSLVVGVVFYALSLPEDRTARYFARLFLRTGNGSSGVRHTGTATQAGSGHGILATPLRQRAQRVSGSQTPAVGVVGHSAEFAHTAMDYSDNELVLSESIIDIDGNLEGLSLGSLVAWSLSSTSPLRLEVEYARSLQRSDVNDTATVATQRTLASHTTTSAHATTPAVVYTLRARLVDGTLSATSHPSSSSASTAAAERRFFSHISKPKETSATVDPAGNTASWGLEVPVNLANHVKCQGGQAFAGLDASGLKLTTSRDHGSTDAADADAFAFRLTQLQFSGRGTLSSYPVTSAPTAARHPDTAARVQEEVDRVRAWMHIKLSLNFPPMFRVIFDADAVTCYERVFAAIMKVRLVAHALERLWIARSRLASDRSFCQSRHSMHFFVSNLLYYLQVDVVDSEYSTLQKDIAEAADFQAVLRAHKTFTANVLRLSLIDNLSVQEGIDRILHICLRFIAICRIMHRSEFLDVDDGADGAGGGGVSEPNTPSNKGTGVLSDADRITLLHAPIYVPPEELEFIRWDFFAQVSLLFQMMRKVESRGFIFRLDFNNYLSAAASGSVPL